ncbi:MAG: hypothetical protein Tsb009_05990 [Planctomycetaceae bacterium]
MADRPVDELTLREVFTEAERHSREMIDHLEKGFLPKSHSVLKLVRNEGTEPELGDVEDITIYNTAERLLKSEEFSEQIYSRLETLMIRIDSDITEIVSG